MRTAVVVSSLLLAASPARAEKSEKTSVALAATGTGVSSALILAAFLVDAQDADVHMPTLYAGIGTSVITPSLGHLYSEQWLTIGMGIRAAAGALALYGLSQKEDHACLTRPADNCPETTGTGLTIVSLAAIAYIGGIAYDVRDAGAAARRYNKRQGTTATITPTAVRHGAGLSLVGSF